MHSRLGHFFRRLRFLFRKPAKTPSYDNIVREYFDSGCQDVEELADALGMTPIELYSKVKREATDVRTRLPEKYQPEIRRIIHQNVFGS